MPQWRRQPLSPLPFHEKRSLFPYNISDIFINVPLNSREIMHCHLAIFSSSVNLRPCIPHLPPLVIFYLPVTGFSGVHWDITLETRCILCLALFLSHSFTSLLFWDALPRKVAVKEKFTWKWNISHHLLNPMLYDLISLVVRKVWFL